mgnify:FL=1
MEDTQKQDKLPPIKYTKRVGHLFEHVRDLDNLKEAIKDAARHKRKRKEVQKVLKDIDRHALELQRMLDEETFIPAKYTMRRINDGIQKKTRDIAIPRFWPDQCVHHAFVRIFKQLLRFQVPSEQDNHQEVDHAKDQPESQDDRQSCIRIHPERARHGFIHRIHREFRQPALLREVVRPFVNIKHLKGVIADEDRKQHQACVAV